LIGYGDEDGEQLLSHGLRRTTSLGKIRRQLSKRRCVRSILTANRIHVFASSSKRPAASVEREDIVSLQHPLHIGSQGELIGEACEY
jgi:hypothetical protein